MAHGYSFSCIPLPYSCKVLHSTYTKSERAIKFLFVFGVSIDYTGMDTI